MADGGLDSLRVRLLCRTLAIEFSLTNVSVKDALELILRRAQGQLDQTSFAMIISSLQQGMNNTSLDAWSAEADLASLLVREPQLSEEGLSAVVGAIMTARSAELVRRGVIADIPVTPMWLAAATRLFLALDIFKFGHLDLDSMSLLFLAALSDSRLASSLNFPKSLFSCGVVLLHDAVMSTSTGVNTSTDVKLLSDAAVSFHVFLTYLATIGCEEAHIAAICGAVDRLQQSDASTATGKPWMSSVLDCVRHPAAAHHLLLHGSRVLTQACAQCLSEPDTFALLESLVGQCGVPITSEVKQDIASCVRKCEQSCLGLAKVAALSTATVEGLFGGLGDVAFVAAERVVATYSAGDVDARALPVPGFHVAFGSGSTTVKSSVATPASHFNSTEAQPIVTVSLFDDDGEDTDNNILGGLSAASVDYSDESLMVPSHTRGVKASSPTSIRGGGNVSSVGGAPPPPPTAFRVQVGEYRGSNDAGSDDDAWGASDEVVLSAIGPQLGGPGSPPKRQVPKPPPLTIAPLKSTVLTSTPVASSTFPVPGVITLTASLFPAKPAVSNPTVRAQRGASPQKSAARFVPATASRTKPAKSSPLTQSSFANQVPTLQAKFIPGNSGMKQSQGKRQETGPRVGFGRGTSQPLLRPRHPPVPMSHPRTQPASFRDPSFSSHRRRSPRQKDRQVQRSKSMTARRKRQSSSNSRRRRKFASASDAETDTSSRSSFGGVDFGTDTTTSPTASLIRQQILHQAPPPPPAVPRPVSEAPAVVTAPKILPDLARDTPPAPVSPTPKYTIHPDALPPALFEDVATETEQRIAHELAVLVDAMLRTTPDNRAPLLEEIRQCRERGYKVAARLAVERHLREFQDDDVIPPPLPSVVGGRAPGFGGSGAGSPHPSLTASQRLEDGEPAVVAVSPFTPNHKKGADDGVVPTSIARAARWASLSKSGQTREVPATHTRQPPADRHSVDTADGKIGAWTASVGDSGTDTENDMQQPRHPIAYATAPRKLPVQDPAKASPRAWPRPAGLQVKTSLESTKGTTSGVDSARSAGMLPVSRQTNSSIPFNRRVSPTAGAKRWIPTPSSARSKTIADAPPVVQRQYVERTPRGGLSRKPQERFVWN